MKIVVATSNQGKLSELRELLPDHLVLLTSSEIGITMPDETGLDFIENALIKARAAAKSGNAAVADDSGLMVDALGGAPGIFSARFAGELATDDDNNCKLVELLDGLKSPDRAARFVSAVAVVTPDGQEFCATGSVEGRIVDEPRGTNGFGYDPHFEIDDSHAQSHNGRTMAEISIGEKNSISHRARAYRSLLRQLAQVEFFGEAEPVSGGMGKRSANGLSRR